MANHIEPTRYLSDVFTKRPQAESIEDYELLLPWRYAEAAGTGSMLKKSAA